MRRMLQSGFAQSLARLLTISATNNASVVQTMNYDASGRLGGVTESFGQQCTLGYDSQNRLIVVTRQ
jgi:YD repeat-containing protein